MKREINSEETMHAPVIQNTEAQRSRLRKLVIKFICREQLRISCTFLVVTVTTISAMALPVVQGQNFYRLPQQQQQQHRHQQQANSMRLIAPQSGQLTPSQRQALEHLIRTNYHQHHSHNHHHHNNNHHHHHMHQRHVQQRQQRGFTYPNFPVPADRRTSSSSSSSTSSSASQPTQHEPSNLSGQTAEDNKGKLLVCYYTTRQTAAYWPKDAREYLVPPEGSFVSPANDPSLNQEQPSASNFVPLMHYEPFLGETRSPSAHSSQPIDFIPGDNYKSTNNGMRKSQPQALKLQNRQQQQQQLIFKSAPQFATTPTDGFGYEKLLGGKNKQDTNVQFLQSLEQTTNVSNKQQLPHFYQSAFASMPATTGNPVVVAGGQTTIGRMPSPTYSLIGSDSSDGAANNNGAELSNITPPFASSSSAPSSPSPSPTGQLLGGQSVGNNGNVAANSNFIIRQENSNSINGNAGNNGNYHQERMKHSGGKQAANKMQQLAFPSHLSRASSSQSFIVGGGGGGSNGGAILAFDSSPSASSLQLSASGSKSIANTNSAEQTPAHDTKSHLLVQQQQHNNYRQPSAATTTSAHLPSLYQQQFDSLPYQLQQKEKSLQQLDELQLSPVAGQLQQQQQQQHSHALTVALDLNQNANSLSLDSYPTFQDINKLQQPFLHTMMNAADNSAVSLDQRSPTNALGAPTHLLSAATTTAIAVGGGGGGGNLANVASNSNGNLLTSVASKSTTSASNLIHNSHSSSTNAGSLKPTSSSSPSAPTTTTTTTTSTTSTATEQPMHLGGGASGDAKFSSPANQLADLSLPSPSSSGFASLVSSSSTPKNSHSLLHQQQKSQQQQSASNLLGAANGNNSPSLSSALVSSPLSTMFDVFGAASQYLMRFKPSSLISPSSFAFNSLQGDHQSPSGSGHPMGQLSQHNSILSGPRIPQASNGSLLYEKSTLPERPIDRSSGSNSIGGSILARFTGASQSSQRREDVCGRTIQTPERRIIGGEGARYGEFPYQVHIKIAKHQCGGALVDKQSIVTAAHCVYHFITRAPVSKLQIVIGAYDIEDEQYQELPPQYFKVNQVKLHPNFRFSASHPDRYDIAILKLDKPVKYTDNVLPVCLPNKDLKFEHMIGTVTGFGKTDPSLSNRYGTRLLQKVDVPIIENNECERWHRTRGIDLKIFPEMMCAGYEDGLKDACVGDSGGPLVVKTASGPNGSFRWTLAGITSAGFGCAQSRQPGIYHRVSHTVDWILENLD